MRVQRILFPTDFSECAEQVFPYAQQLARRFEAKLYVLYAAPESGQQDDPMAFLDLKPESGAVRSDTATAESVSAGSSPSEAPSPAGADSARPDSVGSRSPRRRAARKDFLPIHSRITSSNPVEGILSYAREHHIDLIVMGTHGRTGIDHLLGGSVAEEVVRHAECPVITIRCQSNWRGPRDSARVLLPVDLTEQQALSSALDLVRLFGTEVDVLHVVEEAVLPTIYGVEPLSAGGPLYIERTHGALCKLLERQDLEGLSVHTHVNVGSPGRRIIEFAREADHDLIIMPTHGRTGIGRLLMGSVAEKVVRLSPVPVLTFNRRTAEDRTENSRSKASEASNGTHTNADQVGSSSPAEV